MKRFIGAIAAMSLSLGVADAYAQNFSTGAVNQYSTCGITPDLDNRLEDAKRFRDWYTQAGFPLVTRWENDDVWNTDFTDGPGKDMDPSGGRAPPHSLPLPCARFFQDQPHPTQPADFVA